MNLTSLKTPLMATGRLIVTLAAVAVAAALAWRLWQHYEVEPWTRDGRVKADVVQVAPDLTGQVTEVLVRDNQQVKIGQVLFEIDRARFELALRQAEAAEQAQRAALDQAIKESRRNTELRDLVAAETREQGVSHVDQLRAALAQAVVNRDVAKLNLARTRVVSAVNGMVSNLDLRAGSYVSAGHAVMALIDTDSYYVEGYFEETKLPKIALGDAATVLPMGGKQRLMGHVESLSGGIADRDRTTSANLLSSVNPTFNWVRLAQRIPVRIKLDPLPAGARLVAGQTVTVDVRNGHS
ncbi:HlyD family efflux transporter periplasmic adaptor subunit [Duganella aceris]|uniref:HlyD family secretion protein n=1 Tax=Duganella aceris TaxID=2703883 RepID=A0ABX0FNU9_9BURK|nr:HlyD family secretion protein [Duganella aceris]NGZ86204.1 HlyD family secretion protein [Duganella aceris]